MNYLRKYDSGILDIELSIKTVLIASLATVALLSAVGSALIGPSPFYDATTMGITLALCSLLFGVLFWSGEVLLPMFALLAAFFLLFIFTRTLTFLYFPEWVHLPLSVTLSVKQINYGYAYIAIGTLAICAGFVFGGIAYKKLIEKGRVVRVVTKVYPLNHLILVFATVCLVQLYIALWLGDSIMSDMFYGVENKFVGVLSVLFSSAQAFLVVAISMLASKKQGGMNAGKLAMFSFAFLLTITALGSRSGGLQIFQVVLVVLFVLHGNFREKLKNYFIFFFLIALFSFVAFPAATAIRTTLLAERDGLPVRALAPAPAPASAPDSSGNILSRLGAGFDTAVLTLSLDADQKMLSDTMNIQYALKSAVNVIVPGEIFADAPINTTLLWPYIYKLRDNKLLQKGYYESFLWTPWGLVYSMFGWVAGLIALLAAGFILQAVYMGIAGIAGKWQPYLLSWFLLNVFSFYSIMGLDDWLVGLQKSFFVVVLVLLMLWVVGCLARLRIFAWLGNDG